MTRCTTICHALPSGNPRTRPRRRHGRGSYARPTARHERTLWVKFQSQGTGGMGGSALRFRRWPSSPDGSEAGGTSPFQVRQDGPTFPCACYYRRPTWLLDASADVSPRTSRRGRAPEHLFPRIHLPAHAVKPQSPFSCSLADSEGRFTPLPKPPHRNRCAGRVPAPEARVGARTSTMSHEPFRRQAPS